MNFLSNFLYKYGVWFFLSGGLGFFVSASYLDSPVGIVLFVVFLFLFTADPVFFLYGKFIHKEDRGSGLWIAYALAFVSVLAYLLRQWIHVSLTDLAAGEEAFLPRLRLLLLFLYLISFVAALLFRLMVFLSEGRLEAGASGRIRRRTHLRNAFVSILAVFTILVFLNYLSSIRNPIIDFSGRLSFSDRSTPLISSIQEEVHVYAFLPEAQHVRTRGRTGTRELSRIADDIRVMLEQLPILNSRIKLEFLNADLATYEGNEFGNVNNGTIIVRKYKPELKDKNEKPYAERRVYVYTERDMKKLERELTRALVYVSAPKTTACFPVLNGERFGSDPTLKGAGIESLKEQLSFFNTSLRALGQEQKWPGPVPEDCEVLFLMGPRTPYGKEAREAIQNFIQKGGDAFIAIDPSSKEKFAWLLQQAGGPFYEAQSEILFNTRLPAVALTDSTAGHRITDTFVGAKRPPIVLLNHSWFEKRIINRDADAGKPDFDNKKNKNFMQKSKPALEAHFAPQTQKKDPRSGGGRRQGKDAPGADAQTGQKTHPVFRSLSDLLATEIVFSMHQSFVDRNRNSLPDKNEQVGRKPVALVYAQPGNPESPRLVVFSGVDFLSDRAMNFPIQSSNLQLAADSLHWMTESPLLGEAVPEDPAVPTVQLTDAVKLRLLVLGVLVFPLLMGGGLAIAIAIYRKRRRFVE